MRDDELLVWRRAGWGQELRELFEAEGGQDRGDVCVV